VQWLGCNDRSSNPGSRKSFSLLQRYRPAPRPSFLLLIGYRGLSMGVKRPGREVDHSPPSRAGWRTNGAIHLVFPYAFVSLKGTALPYVFKICKHGDIATFRSQFQQISRSQLLMELKKTVPTDVSLKHVLHRDWFIAFIGLIMCLGEKCRGEQSENFSLHTRIFFYYEVVKRNPGSVFPLGSVYD
jgi:hypothetical protein